MRTEKRTDENPWQSIDVMTDDCVGWYSSDLAAYQDAVDEGLSVSVLYRPKRKKVSK